MAEKEEADKALAPAKNEVLGGLAPTTGTPSPVLPISDAACEPEKQTDCILRLLESYRDLAGRVVRELDPTSLASIAAVSRHWRAAANNARGPGQSHFVL
jgi:hypothetical protein